MRWARLIGLVVIAIAAMWVTVGLAPEPAPSYDSGAMARAAALSDAAANAANTENVYQQIVVNGWAAKDLLEVISRQLDNVGNVSNPIEDQRTEYLLLLGVLAVCWIGITSSSPAKVVAEPVPMGLTEVADTSTPHAAWVAEESRQAERLQNAGLMSGEEFEAKRAELLEPVADVDVPTASSQPSGRGLGSRPRWGDIAMVIAAIACIGVGAVLLLGLAG